MSEHERMNASQREQMASHARIVKAAQVMTAVEKAAFESWEKENITGDGTSASTDWPGWEAIFARIAILNGHD